MPACNTLFIGRVPPAEKPSPRRSRRSGSRNRGQGARLGSGRQQGPPVIIDTDQVHPLTQLVQMGNVQDRLRRRR